MLINMYNNIDTVDQMNVLRILEKCVLVTHLKWLSWQARAYFQFTRICLAQV